MKGDRWRDVMVTKTWDVSGHRVMLKHGTFSGKAEIVVDGRTLFLRPTTLFDWGFTARFDIGITPCAVCVQPRLLKCERELIVGPEARYVRGTDRLPFDLPYFIECCIPWSLSIVILFWIFFG
jgi:hypothetical protein